MSNQSDYSLLDIFYVLYNIRVKGTLSPKDTGVQFILVTVSESNAFNSLHKGRAEATQRAWSPHVIILIQLCYTLHMHVYLVCSVMSDGV